MSQILSEELIQEREELFFEMVHGFIDKHYDVDEDYVMTEDDAYILSIMLEHFEENFRFPTLEESTLQAITGYDINQDLYEEMAYVMLDETVGTFIAGALHNIGKYMATRKYHKVAKTAEKAKAASKERPLKNVEKSEKITAKTDYGSGLKGTFLKAFHQSADAAARKHAEDLKAKAQEAERIRKTAQMNKINYVNKSVKKRDELAKKIDTGVEKVKQAPKKAAYSGATKAGKILGTVAGRKYGVYE